MAMGQRQPRLEASQRRVCSRLARCSSQPMGGIALVPSVPQLEKSLEDWERQASESVVCR